MKNSSRQYSVQRYGCVALWISRSARASERAVSTRARSPMMSCSCSWTFAGTRGVSRLRRTERTATMASMMKSVEILLIARPSLLFVQVFHGAGLDDDILAGLPGLPGDRGGGVGEAAGDVDGRGPPEDEAGRGGPAGGEDLHVVPGIITIF